MGGEIQWPKTNKLEPLPSVNKKMSGRPPVKRKRSRTEVDGNRAGISAIRRKCLNCYQYGYNRRSYTNAPFTVTLTVPSQRGRPRVHDPIRIRRMNDTSVNMSGGNTTRGRGMGGNATRRGKCVPSRGGDIRTRSHVSVQDSVKERGSSENVLEFVQVRQLMWVK